VPPKFDRQRLSCAWWNRDIDIGRIGRDTLHRPGLPPESPADQADVRAVIVGDHRDVRRLHLLVARLGHFERRRQIRPELKAMHAPRLVALRQFLMDDAAAGGHPLDVSGGDRTLVPQAVAMLDGSRQDVRNRFDAAMRMPRKARQVVFGHIVSEIVEQQERIVLGRFAEAEGAAQMHACAFQRGLRGHELLDRTDRHRTPRLSSAGPVVKRRSTHRRGRG
jgi:hypothetical protein